MKFLLKCLASLGVALVLILEFHNYRTRKKNSQIQCGQFSNESDIERDNEFWQIFRTHDGIIFYLLNAYVDDRGNKSVAIIVMEIGSASDQRKFYCQFWMKDETDVVAVSEATLVKRRI